MNWKINKRAEIQMHEYETKCGVFICIITLFLRSYYDGVYHLESLGFWTLQIVENFK
jgi:hypothetical protein